MKKGTITRMLLTTMITVLISCQPNASSTGITIAENDVMTKFEAHYRPNKSDQLVDFFDENLSREIFENGTTQDKEVVLGDSLRFNIYSKEGELKIKFEKKSNTESGYKYLSKLVRKIGKVIE